MRYEDSTDSGAPDGGDFQNSTERAFLVGVSIRNARPLLAIEDSLDELALLATTAEIAVVGRAYQNISAPNPATLIGSGKLEEIREEVAALEANVVIFDDELSPRHQRELEKVFGLDVKVIDRSALILDIFARHAQTREGALQVELAQYEYRLPRLTRQWTHLARQTGGGAARAGGGGVGLRGPGETQLEVDRREIGRIITRLKRDLEDVRAHRGRHRKQRKLAGTPVAAFVGYTNAGKSTLLNALSSADVYAADQLFATLDPTTRRVELPGGRQILFSDTVGFIQKLPTTLIAAFRATLEEISEADLILHVADSSHINLSQQIEVVEDTLAELDLPSIPRILVLNKIDRLGVHQSPIPMSVDLSEYEAVVPISAQKHTGLEMLLGEIDRILTKSARHIRVFIPYTRMDILALIHENGSVLHEDSQEEGMVVEAHVDSVTASRVLSVADIYEWPAKG